MATAKFILWVFGVCGTAGFTVLGIMSGVFPATLEKLRIKANAMMETPSKARRRFLTICYLALAAYFAATTVVYLNSANTPTHDDAMRLVAALDTIGHKWETNGLPPYKNTENFAESEYGHWILRVHNELVEHFRETDAFDEIARNLDRMGVNGLFTDATKPPAIVLFGVRDQIKRLAETLKE
jgi:hypothetical protein